MHLKRTRPHEKFVRGHLSRATNSTSLRGGEKTCIDCHKGIAHRLPDMAATQ
jgi:cytochrome c-type protein NapC